MTDWTPMIGFMQGRLSPIVGGRIQAFPAEHWRAEFAAAEQHGFPLMEWTIDADDFADNPFMTPGGRAEIRELGRRHGVAVNSLTADCFMQAPFFKASGAEADQRYAALENLVAAASELGLKYVVLPLVDNGSVEDAGQARRLYEGLNSLKAQPGGGELKIIFESDFGPADLARFIADYPADRFGINYDIGNSASLGYDPSAEFGAYAARIDNVHVKDRVRGGSTVPLGQGDAKLSLVFQLLVNTGYRGDVILQTARATDDDHAGALVRYRDQVRAWIAQAP
jgi:L-ribulose-5-phosphate 3-epimerase